MAFAAQQKGRALFLAVTIPTVGVPIQVAVYLSQGHSCTYVCRIIHPDSWDSPSAWEWLKTDSEAQAARDAGVDMCSFLWDGAIPTVSFTGAAPPEYYILCSSLVLASIFGWIGFEGLHLQLRSLDRETSAMGLFNPSNSQRHEPFLRWISRLSMLSLSGAGIVSLTMSTVGHNSLAALFYLSLITHGIILWGTQLSAWFRLLCTHPKSCMHWLRLVGRLREEAPRHQMKGILLTLYLLTTIVVCTVLPALYFQPGRAGARTVRVTIGPILEWWVTELLNAMVFVHACDMASSTIVAKQPSQQPRLSPQGPGTYPTAAMPSPIDEGIHLENVVDE